MAKDRADKPRKEKDEKVKKHKDKVKKHKEKKLSDDGDVEMTDAVNEPTEVEEPLVQSREAVSTQIFLFFPKLFRKAIALYEHVAYLEI